jgi:hypothetical protein
MTQTNGKRVLLISNSTLYGSGYLDHAEREIRNFLGNIGEVLFVPFALYDRDAYASMAREVVERLQEKPRQFSSVAETRSANDPAAGDIRPTWEKRRKSGSCNSSKRTTLPLLVCEKAPWLGQKAVRMF